MRLLPKKQNKLPSKDPEIKHPVLKKLGKSGGKELNHDQAS